VSLRPRQFHSNLVFLDEFNFGTMQLDRVRNDELDDSIEFSFPDSEDANSTVVPTVVTAWSVMNYLRSERAQLYFRVTMGRFSKEVLKRQMELVSQDGILPIVGALGMADQLLVYKRKLISKHIAASLTRAVGEILKEVAEEEDSKTPPVRTYGEIRSSSGSFGSPALEFVKNIIAVLELDTDIEAEVAALKRSLLTQLGVAEYAQVAQWTNPCPSFILSDVFCSECQETRDVNLCYIPPRPFDLDQENEEQADGAPHHWSCDECGAVYNIHIIEGRLLHLVHKKMARYVLQDVRCSKTNMIASRTLAALSASSQTLKLDVSSQAVAHELRLLHSLAEQYGLEILLSSYC
jgi:DNA polymerase epsilon subunit 1